MIDIVPNPMDFIPSPYRSLALLLALALAAGGGAVINGWRLGARYEAALASERARYDALAVLVREQNRAIDALGMAKSAADARGVAAQQLAAESGRRYDRALEQIKGAHATTCVEAMPAVNAMLEAIR